MEIGPGPGALTEALLNQGAEVIAIEKDKLFASALHFEGHLKVIEADILTCDLKEILGGRRAKVVANLPYQITTPILQKLLPMHNYFTTLTLMVQKEYGERMVAPVGSSAYSSLTLFVRYYAMASLCFLVSPASFYPRPKVESCVVHLQLHTHPPKVPEEHFFSITRRAFQQRRKMLRSSLAELFTPSKVEDLLEQLGLSRQARPEQLSFEQFERLARSLYE